MTGLVFFKKDAGLDGLVVLRVPLYDKRSFIFVLKRLKPV
jgi:hypothetical protein